MEVVGVAEGGWCEGGGGCSGSGKVWRVGLWSPGASAWMCAWSSVGPAGLGGVRWSRR